LVRVDRHSDARHRAAAATPALGLVMSGIIAGTSCTAGRAAAAPTTTAV
jgi:hypothetical protein